MVIKLSENHQFNVAQVENVKLNKCSDCEEVADLVFYPCSHNTFCSGCKETKLKKCPKCKEAVDYTEIYYEFSG